MIKIKAFAKINLVLDLLAKRPDGYHELRSVMQSVSCADLVTIKKSGLPGIKLLTNKEITARPEDNLAYRAALLFFSKIKEPAPAVEITIEKNIPLAAGLAGGSADCAAVIAGLNKLFAAKLSGLDLEEIASSLGSDISFCLYGGTMLAEGRGEKLTALPFAGKFYGLLLKPPFPVSTAKVYGAVPRQLRPCCYNNIPEIYFKESKKLEQLAANCRNDLYEYAREIEPRIDIFLKKVQKTNPAVCQMSGSGPTIFAFYFSEKERNEALSVLEKEEVYAIETVKEGLEFSIF